MNILKIIILILLLTVPSFWRMLRPGIHTVQDPVHYFRLVEFDKCVKARQIPCRWAPDAGLGYGEPVFNFYGQVAYAVGEVFHLLGVSFIDSLKLLFVISLLGSAISMFFLARYLWHDDFAALISSMVYVYAPYRAVDVWVRGNLPEALSFVLFPLILLAIEKRSFLGFSLVFALLVLIHNLSTFMFLPIILFWVAYRRFWMALPAGFLSLVLSAFYLLPVIFEAKYINLESTTQGYFDFRGHFATLYQLLISRFWGYGASLFKETEMSRSVGHLQWLVPTVTLILILAKKKVAKYKDLLALFVLGWAALFLAHNKSTFIWVAIPPMAYIQFPWRFLAIAVFCFSLAAGATLLLVEKYKLIVAAILTFLVIVLNYSFFKEDIWQKVGDSEMLSGKLWETQISASTPDFWPKFGHEIPKEPATGEFINYFPGWNYHPDENGLIPSAGAVFSDTPVRRIGNIISLATLLGLVFYQIKLWKEKA